MTHVTAQGGMPLGIFQAVFLTHTKTQNDQAGKGKVVLSCEPAKGWATQAVVKPGIRGAAGI